MSILYYGLVILLGFIVAFAELLARSSEGPSQIFKVFPSYVYLGINGLASAMAYWFVSGSYISVEQTYSTEVLKIVLSGLSAMALLRSSFGSVKIDGKIFEAGIAPIVQVFLNSAERAFDRKRSQIDLKELTQIMDNIDFNKAEKDLPILSSMVLQNLSELEQKKIGNEVSKLSQAGLKFNKTKSLALGRIVAFYTGLPLLKQVVTSLSDRISIIDKEVLNASEEEKVKELTELIKKLEK